MATKMLLANAQHRGQEVYVADYKAAYIQAKWPKGIPKVIGKYKGKMLEVMKPLYGLKQSGNLWRKMIEEIYNDQLGFTMDKVEKCLFRRKDKYGGIVTLIIYVDDILYTCSDERTRARFERETKD